MSPVVCRLPTALILRGRSEFWRAGGIQRTLSYKHCNVWESNRSGLCVKPKFYKVERLQGDGGSYGLSLVIFYC